MRRTTAVLTLQRGLERLRWEPKPGETEVSPPESTPLTHDTGHAGAPSGKSSGADLTQPGKTATDALSEEETSVKRALQRDTGRWRRITMVTSREGKILR